MKGMIFSRNQFDGAELDSSLSKVVNDVELMRFSNAEIALVYAARKSLDFFIVQYPKKSQKYYEEEKKETIAFVDSLRKMEQYRYAHILLNIFDIDAHMPDIFSFAERNMCCCVFESESPRCLKNRIEQFVSKTKTKKCESKFLEILSGREKRIFKLNSLISVEKGGRYYKFETEKETAKIEIRNCNDVCDFLLKNNFISINRWDLINREYIDKINGNKLYIKNSNEEYHITKLGEKNILDLIDVADEKGFCYNKQDLVE